MSANDKEVRISVNEENLEEVRKYFEDALAGKREVPRVHFCMLLNESGNGEEPEISEESRRISAEGLTRID